MLVTISPAKSLDWSPVAQPATAPARQADAARLARRMRNLGLGELKALMHLSDDLARLNRDRFRAFADHPSPEITKPALFAFAGDTYQGFNAATLAPEGLARAQERLRILSGLYGVLRPLDAIQPYRLEMGSRLKTRRGASLYAYWGREIAKDLRAAAQDAGAAALVNCASQEYFGAVDLAALRLPVVTPQFLEVKDGRPRVVSFFAKRARGAMARFIIDNALTAADDLRAFGTGGYAYAPDISTPESPAFTRPYDKT